MNAELLACRVAGPPACRARWRSRRRSL